MSFIDIKSAYWHIPLNENSRELTAFTIRGRGLFHFKRMPFGLTNAPATFQSFVDTILGADLEPHVVIYLGDMIVLTSDFETHLEVLDRLLAAGLTLSLEKCHFCRPQLKYLAYVVEKEGLRVAPFRSNR